MQGIMFKEILVQQTVLGNKTMTRREGGLKEVNDAPDEWAINVQNLNEDGVYTDHRGILVKDPKFIHVEFQHLPSGRSIYYQQFPRYKAGEVVYIKETFVKCHSMFSANGYAYKFGLQSEDDLAVNLSGNMIKRGSRTSPIKWKNKMFMPAEAARYFIKITRVRIERLMDISDVDCIKEGIQRYPVGDYKNYQSCQKQGNRILISPCCKTPRESFFSLFRFANKMKRDAELKNIWCWVYEYEFLKDYKA